MLRNHGGYGYYWGGEEVISAWWLLLCFPAAWMGMLVMALCAMAKRKDDE